MAGLRGAIALVICCLSWSVLAAVQTLEWNVTYTTANPDGLQERRVIGVNGKWPPPQIDLNYGDRLVLTVNNQLDDVTTGLHAHGLYQNGTNYFDGPIGVTQWYYLVPHWLYV
jgi:iron transport multicopper oxidase